MVFLKSGRKTFPYSLFWLTSIVSLTEGQQYNLRGSSEFAVLGEAFTWTCDTSQFVSKYTNAIKFLRNENNLCAVLYQVNDKCANQSANPRYTYGCSSESTYTLTIPAENMTEYEQNSKWRCEYAFNSSYRSPDMILKIAIDVYNVSMLSNDNPLTIREGTQRKLRCVVNSNAVPAPTITWYLVSTDITSIVGTDTTLIIITGNKEDNTKTLQCRASNNNKPPKTASTMLNVEYKPTTNTLSQRNIIEGSDLSVTCTVTPGNPSSTIVFWTIVGNSVFKQNGPTLQLPNIQRTSSGTYRCTAENIYSNGEKGIDSQHMVVNVLYPPFVNTLSQIDIIEGKYLSVTCTATPGNPSSTSFYWTKVADPSFRQDGFTLQLHNIDRSSSGIYRCIAENIYSNGEKGTDSQSMVVNVLYPPFVKTLTQQNIIEGRNLSVTCTATPGNPSSTTFYWTQVDNVSFRQDGSALQLYNIHRSSSGTYRCTVENSYSNRVKGTNSQSMVVNVMYQPVIENRPLAIVNESETVILTRNISSNPLSNVSWYSKTKLLKTQTSVPSTTFTIEKATCIDTQNFTLVASNGVGSMATTVVELIVNCKPIPDKKNITLGVTFTTGIEFSIKIIAYPEPQYKLVYENRTRNNQMLNNITRNAVNNFTVYFRQSVVDQKSFGLYYLTMQNLFGESTVTVNVIEQRTGRPVTPRSIAVVCEITQARVQWISSFNGGDQQYFTVVILNGQDGTNISYRFHDNGKNELHAAHISNLQPSVTYWFVVSAKNSYGSSPSEITRCKTEQEKESFKTGMVAGSVGGALVLITIVLILGIVLHKRYTCICKIALEKKDRNTRVEANKDKSNYSTIQEQQEHSERNMYDALTSTENANQYEDILKKDNNGYDEKFYEKLQSSADKDNEANSSKRRTPLKIKDLKDGKFITQNTEEYANTSFMK